MSNDVAGHVDVGDLATAAASASTSEPRRRIDGGQAFEHRVDRLAERDQLAADVLRQRPDEGGHELGPMTGDLPVEAVGAHLVESGQRDVDGHPVERLAGREAVRERQLDHGAPATLRPDVGIVGEAHPVAAPTGDQFVGQIEEVRVPLPLGLPPPVEVTHRRHLGADAVGVEVEEHLVVDQFEPAHSRSHPPEVLEELGVAGEELLPAEPARCRRRRVRSAPS